MGHFQTSILVHAPVHEVFSFVTDLENLEFLLAPEMEVEFQKTPPTLAANVEIECLLSRFGVPVETVVRIEEFTKDEKLSYRQVQGIFKKWHHAQILSQHSDDSTLLTDVVDYKLPLGILGALVDDLWARHDLEHLLFVRLKKIADYFEQARRVTGDKGSEGKDKEKTVAGDDHQSEAESNRAMMGLSVEDQSDDVD